MADDRDDLDNLKDAFAALEQSRRRVDAIVEHDAYKAPVPLEPMGLADLIEALRSGAPLSEEKRARIIDCLNVLAITAQVSDRRDLEH
jgi:hypothetical protein